MEFVILNDDDDDDDNNNNNNNNNNNIPLTVWANETISKSLRQYLSNISESTKLTHKRRVKSHLPFASIIGRFNVHGSSSFGLSLLSRQRQ
jgi:hypothetical protein